LFSRVSQSPSPALVRGITLALALLAAFVFSTIQSASARTVWCAGDPTIIVNGNPVSITVSVPLDRLSDIDDVTVTYHVPSNANVAATLNTGILFREKTVIVKDQPPMRGLVTISKIPVDITVHHRGSSFGTGATEVALGGTRLWVDGNSDTVLHATTYGLLNIGLL